MYDVSFLRPWLINRWAAYLHDLLWVPVALAAAYLMRLDATFPSADQVYGLFVLLLFMLPVQAISFVRFGLYRGIWRFASVPDLIRILQAVWVGAAILAVLVFVLLPVVWQPPWAVVLAYPILLTMGLTAPRMFYRWWQDFQQPSGTRRRALIVGAGWAGGGLARELIRSRNYLPVGFLDDDPLKQGRDLHGVPVLGSLSDLDYHFRTLDLQIVLIAMPNAPPELLRRVVDRAAHFGISCITMPNLSDWAEGEVRLSRLREVRIDDLLGRQQVDGQKIPVSQLLDGKRVLVTGAGGSIGAELCRQIAGCQPELLVMFDHSEYNLYRVDQEMQEHAPVVPFVSLLGDVTDAVRMRQVFARFRPQIVLHAAAYKHVPLLEGNLVEGVRANVLGTQRVADLAAVHGCERFVLVSTDKAVRPTNIMGASKRVAELYCQSLCANSGPAYIVTRFGNVMGSTGSVVPLFQRQIAAGGPVTVTHPEITRYFMTISEAVGLILQAAAMGEGGEVYVLDMGKPVRVRDLAEEMIRLSGHEPGRDIEIRYIGLRPGEKLHEELFHEHENPVGTHHPKIMQAQVASVSLEWMRAQLKALERACATYDEDEVRSIIIRMVPELPRSAKSIRGGAEDSETAATALKVVGSMRD